MEKVFFKLLVTDDYPPFQVKAYGLKGSHLRTYVLKIYHFMKMRRILMM